jgi:hypothetical protein
MLLHRTNIEHILECVILKLLVENYLYTVFGAVVMDTI